MFHFLKSSIVVALLVLTGCATQSIPPELLNSQHKFKNENDAFLIMLSTMMQNTSTSVYNDPVDKINWVYINDSNDVHFYINRKELVINKENNTIVFTSLYDLRDTEYKRKKMLYYVVYDGIVNCNTKSYSVIQRSLVDIASKNSHSIHIDDDFDVKTINGSVGVDMCFILSMIQK